MLVKSAPYIEWNAFAVAIVISGIFLMLANFKAAHMVMHYVNKRMAGVAEQDSSEAYNTEYLL